MLTTLKEVLAFAEEKKAAIPAFNIDNMEIVQSIIKASEEENYPVILAVGQAAIKDPKRSVHIRRIWENNHNCENYVSGRKRTPCIIYTKK